MGNSTGEQRLPTKTYKLKSPFDSPIDRTRLIRLLVHHELAPKDEEEYTPALCSQTKAPAETSGIDMSDLELSDLEEYTTPENTIISDHRPLCRPVCDPNDPAGAVVVASSRIVTYDSVAKDKRLWVKGTNFSLTGLVMDTEIGAHFADAAVASFRLPWPQDHHRYSCPVTGTIKSFRSIPRNRSQASSTAPGSSADALLPNARSYLVIETEQFGDVLLVAIGTMDVRAVFIDGTFRKPGTAIEKGAEVGYFQYGGFAIIVAFEKGAIKFDQDLLELGRQKIQVSVRVGMSLGKANPVKKKAA